VFLGCPPGHLDDLVQDVFLSVLSSRFEDRDPASTAAYLRKAARHLLLKALQRERRQPLVDDLDAAEAVWNEHQAEDAGGRYLEALRECLSRVEGRAHEVVRLRYQSALTRRLSPRASG